MTTGSRWEELREAFTAYARGRQQLLDAIGVGVSNRDPLSDFSEHLVAALLDGQLATNRVQRGWDLTTPSGRRVQVKYLANPGGGAAWINGIAISFGSGPDEPDDFAVVFFDALLPVSVVAFAREQLLEVCVRLKKRHPNQERTLQLTQANYQRLLAERGDFAPHGVRVFDLGAVADHAADTAKTEAGATGELSQGRGDVPA